jgi:hypothetical protein
MAGGGEASDEVDLEEVAQLLASAANGWSGATMSLGSSGMDPLQVAWG